MNCEPGDVCYVISNFGTQASGMADKFLKVTTIYGLDEGGGPAWGYEGEPYICQCGCGEPWHGIGDRVLRPLRDKPGQDETLNWAPVPDKVVA